MEGLAVPAAVSSINTPPILRQAASFHRGIFIWAGQWHLSLMASREENQELSKPVDLWWASRATQSTELLLWQLLCRWKPWISLWEPLVNKVLHVLIRSVLMELITRHHCPRYAPCQPRKVLVPEPFAPGGPGRGKRLREPLPTAPLLSPFISATTENKYL